MPTKAFVSVTLLAAVAATVWWSTARPGAESTPPAPATAPAPSMAARTGAPPPALARVERSTAPAVDDTPFGTGPGAQTTQGVFGRCVAAETGQPLAGCRVVQGGQPPLVTGDDGRFRVPLPAKQAKRDRARLAVVVHAPDRAHVSGTFKNVTAEEGPLDLGDIELALGSVVHGRVVSEAGVAKPKVKLALQRVSAPVRLDAALHTERHTILESDADGVFRSEPLAAGEWQVICNTERIVSTERVALPGGGRSVALDIVCWTPGPTDRIEGIVLDEQGQSLAGAMVGVGHQRRTADAAGRFRLERPADEDGDRAWLWIHAEGYEPGRADTTWGEPELVVTLRRGVAVEVSAHAATDGAAVRRFEVEHEFLGSDPQSRVTRRSTSNPSTGHARLILPRGESLLTVHPEDDALSRSEPILVDVSDHTAPVAVALKPLVDLDVVVTDGRGPVADSLVLMTFQGLGRRRAHAADSLILIGPTLGPVRGRAVPTLRFWGAATTDAEGCATLRAPEGMTATLHIRGDGHLETIVPDYVVRDGADALKITVQTGIAHRVALGPPEVVAQYRARDGYVQLIDPTTGARGFSGKLAADGTAVIPSLRPGRYECVLHCRMPTGTGMLDLWRVRVGDAGHLDATGAREPFARDLRPFAFAKIHGTAYLDGKPLTHGHVRFLARRTPEATPSDEDAEVVGGGAAIGADGSYAFALPAGAWAPLQGDQAGAWRTLAPGADVRWDLHLATPGTHRQPR